MDCYPGSASTEAAVECEACGAGHVCPAGTSLDDLGQELVETTGTLSLDGITEETFESAKADIIEAIKQQVYDTRRKWKKRKPSSP